MLLKTIFFFSLFSWTTVIVSGQQFKQEAKEYIVNSRMEKSKNLKNEGFDLKLKNYHQSKNSGTHHHYFIETYQGIEVFNAIVGVHLRPDGSLLKMDRRKNYSVDTDVPARTSEINESEAISLAARQLNLFINPSLTLQDRSRTQLRNSDNSISIFRNNSLSAEPIPLKMVYQENEDGKLTLAWDLAIKTKEKSDWWSVRVDIADGRILDKINWTSYCNHTSEESENPNHKSHAHTATIIPEDHKVEEFGNAMAGSYRVFALPAAGPFDADRTLMTDPHEISASPYGWHDNDGLAGADYTITRGNNVHAYKDKNQIEYSPDGGINLIFDFPLDTTYTSGNTSEDAAITNVFYIINELHDLFYLYGFDEQSGNFQENNYGHGGIAGDEVKATIQSETNTCNASMSFPIDGFNPTMSVYLCNDHDVAYDGNVIIHEYAHGLTGRLIGGPSQNCIQPRNGGNEGWSDFFSLITTIEQGDQGSDIRQHAKWYKSATGLANNSTRKYSTDSIPSTFTPEYWTFEVIDDGFQPVHTIGRVWCLMLWDVAWALIDQHGFNPDLSQPWNTGGNNLAFQIVIDALKLLPCDANFIDNRDAILAADMALTGGENQCIIWEAFAKRGLGVNATQSFNVSPIANEDFTTPEIFLLKTTNLNTVAGPGGRIDYTIEISNNTICAQTLTNLTVRDTISEEADYIAGTISGSGTVNGKVLTWVIPQLNVGQTINLNFAVEVKTSFIPTTDLVLDDLEAGYLFFESSQTSGINDWTPNPNFYTTETSFFAKDTDIISEQEFLLISPITPTENTVFSFWHSFNTEISYDGGRVQVSTNDGQSWTDLEPYFLQNGYNDLVYDQDLGGFAPGFSGSSIPFIESKIYLGAYAGKSIKIRFLMTTDISVGSEGWYIDLIRINDNNILNKAFASNNGGLYNVMSTMAHTQVEIPCHFLEVATTADKGIGSLRDILFCASSGDTITFSSLLDGKAIQISSGELLMFKDITLLGRGKETTILDGAGNTNSRILSGFNNVSIHIQDLTLQNGGSPSFTSTAGAFYLDGTTTNTTLLNVRFRDNTSVDQGGAIFLANGNLKAINCDFINNSNTTTGSALSVHGNGEAILEQCLIADNLTSGNTIQNLNKLTLRNCTVANNSQAKGIYNTGNLTLYNNIIKNVSGPAVDDDASGSTIGSNNLVDDPGDLAVNVNSNFQGDPLFRDMSMQDYRLTSNSPAVSAADSSLAPRDIYDLDKDGNVSELVPYDLQDSTRIYSCVMDLGVFEFESDGGSAVVLNNNDTGPGSLREIIQCATSGSTITFDPSTNSDSIHLLSGEIIINKNFEFIGNGLNMTVIDGSYDISQDSRLFYIEESTKVTFKNMEFTHGGGMSFNGNGAGIVTGDSCILNLINCRLSDNQTSATGGALYMGFSTELSMYNCFLSENLSSIASAIFTNGISEIYQSVISKNTSTNQSGNACTIENTEDITIIQSTFADNMNPTVTVRSTASSFLLYNTIFADISGEALASNAAALSASNNLVKTNGNQGDLPINNTNIKGDPNFLGSGIHPYSIKNNSSAIARGDDTKIPLDIPDFNENNNTSEKLPYDLKGDNRQYACGVAIGAYEYSQSDYTLSVTESIDGLYGSLRDIIDCAPSGSTIYIPPSTYNINNGEIEIDKNLNILGIEDLTIPVLNGSMDVGQDSRLFDINSGANVVFKNLVFEENGGINFIDKGSALNISGNATVSMTNCEINQNISSEGIISIAQGSSLKTVNSWFGDNEASSNLFDINGEFVADQCVVYDNMINGALGAVFSIASGGTLALQQSTMSGNSGLTNCLDIKSGGQADIHNSIFSSTTGNECANSGVLNATYNLVADSSRAGDFMLGIDGNISGDPKFVETGNNGRQYNLTSTSPAISAGNNVLIPIDILDFDEDLDILEFLSLDIIGNDRIVNCGQVDIGAFEYLNSDIKWLVNNGNDAGQGSLRSALGCAENGDTITFSLLANQNSISLSSGELLINKGLVIKGNGKDLTIVDGILDVNSRLLNITSTSPVQLWDMSFRNGGGNGFTGDGAGIIVNDGQVKLINSKVSNNKTSGRGGALFVAPDKELSVFNTEIDFNEASIGSIAYTEGGLAFVQSLIHHNLHTLSSGAGIMCTGTGSYVDFKQSTMADNTGGDFCVIKSDGYGQAENCIFSNSGGQELYILPGSNASSYAVFNLIDSLSNPGSFQGSSFTKFGVPGFIDRLNADYRLSASSDAPGLAQKSILPDDTYDVDGDNDKNEKLPLDFYGNPRIFGCDQPDFGVHEYQGNDTKVLVFDTNDSGPETLRDIILCAPLSSTIVFSEHINGNNIYINTIPIIIGKDLRIRGNGIQNTIINGLFLPNDHMLSIINNAKVVIDGVLFKK